MTDSSTKRTILLPTILSQTQSKGPWQLILDEKFVAVFHQNLELESESRELQEALEGIYKGHNKGGGLTNNKLEDYLEKYLRLQLVSLQLKACSDELDKQIRLKLSELTCQPAPLLELETFKSIALQNERLNVFHAQRLKVGVENTEQKAQQLRADHGKVITQCEELLSHYVDWVTEQNARSKPD